MKASRFPNWNIAAKWRHRAGETGTRDARTDGFARTGAALLSGLLIVAILGPYVAPYNPLQPSAAIFAPPSAPHLLGTDQFGRDVLSRILFAIRLDLFIAVGSVGAASAVGLAVGAIAGFAGGRFDDVFMRVIDVVQSFPMLILAMALVAVLGVGIVNVMIVTAIVNLAIFARLARSEVLSKRGADYIDAARCSGASPGRLLFVHLIPNIVGPILIQATLSLAWAMLNVAALSFLGIGINPPTPELGIMIAEGAKFLVAGAWWLSVFPGIALAAAVFAFNLLGDALQDCFDPRRRGGWR